MVRSSQALTLHGFHTYHTCRKIQSQFEYVAIYMIYVTALVKVKIAVSGGSRNIQRGFRFRVLDYQAISNRQSDISLVQQTVSDYRDILD